MKSKKHKNPTKSRVRRVRSGKKLTIPNNPEPQSSPHKTKKRLPRPEGITIMMKEARKEQNKTKLMKAKNMIIQFWQRNDFKWYEEDINLQQMANVLHLQEFRIIEEMTKSVKYLVNVGKSNDLAISLTAAAHRFFGALQARYLTHLSAIEGSLRSKNGDLQYKPFVTEAALKTLDGLLNTGKSQFEVAKFFKTPTPTIVNQQANFGLNPTDPQASPVGKYLGPVEAIRLLEAEGRANILDNTALANQAITQNLSDPLPEIIATKQQGLDANGVDVAKPRKIRKNHDDRREADGYIIPEILIP